MTKFRKKRSKLLPLTNNKEWLLYGFGLYLYLSVFAYITNSVPLQVIIVTCAFLYCFFSIKKNYRKDKYFSFISLPIYQLLADITICLEVVAHLFRSLGAIVRGFISDKGFVILLVIIYLCITIPFLSLGIPNVQHPFPYNMDEWHGVLSIKSIFANGTPNTEGAAYGMAFFYVLSGIFLSPFILLSFVDPFSISSSISSVVEQSKLFLLLRLSTVLWGVGSIVVMSLILKQFILNTRIVFLSFFVFTPIFLCLSTYFKYDIAVCFWILLTLYFAYAYIDKPNIQHLIRLCLIASTSVTIKISALPLVLLVFFCYFVVNKHKKSKWKDLLLLSGVSLTTIIVLGMPDIFTHLLDYYYNLLYVNLVRIPAVQQSAFNLNQSFATYLIFVQYPLIFGYFLWTMFLLSFTYLSINLLVKVTNYTNIIYKKQLVTLVGLIFVVMSLVPLKLGAGGNRALVLLPFILLILVFVYKEIINKYNYYQKLVTFLLCIGLILQILQSIAWASIKYFPDPRIFSTEWLVKNISKGEKLGIENVPVYQMVPDIAVKEIYWSFYNVPFSPYYSYQIINPGDKKFPRFVFVSNSDAEKAYLKYSPKLDFVTELKKQGYKEVRTFTPNFYLFDYIGKRRDFALSNLLTMPTSIILYEKVVTSKQ